MEIDKCGRVYDYITHVIAFLPSCLPKILNRNDEKSKFWFAPCSEEEYQEELEVDEEEGMDLDSSDATGG